jgi:acetyltransferase-like isoleucine patch superfamily enzyme
MIKSKIESLKNLIQKRFNSPVTYWRSKGVKIGNCCSLGSSNFGGEPFLITIGNHVQITDNVRFFTHGGGWVFRNEIPDFDIFGKIVIKDNVYIGSGAYIMPGVTIDSNVIVAARSVVTKSVPAGVIIAGNPARIIGTIEDFKNRNLQFNMKTKGLTIQEKITKIKNAPEEMFVTKPFLKGLQV